MVDRPTGSVSSWKRVSGKGAILFFMTVTAGNAAEPSTFVPYVRGSVVESNMDIDPFAYQVRSNFNIRKAQFDDERSTGWSLGLGLRFQRYFGIEVGYADFGVKTLSPPEESLISITTSSVSFRTDTRVAVKGAYVAATGSLPLGNWEPYLKLGALRAETDVEADHITRFYVGPPPRELRTTTEHTIVSSVATTEPMAAVGLTYTFAGHFGVALEATFIPDVGDEEMTGEADLTSMSLALEYRF